MQTNSTKRRVFDLFRLIYFDIDPSVIENFGLIFNQTIWIFADWITKKNLKFSGLNEFRIPNKKIQKTLEEIIKRLGNQKSLSGRINVCPD